MQRGFDAFDRLTRLEAESALLEAAITAGSSAPAAWHVLPPGRALKRLRKRRRLTQGRLGALAGVRQASISRIERGGEVTLFTLSRLYAAMGWELVLLPRPKTQPEGPPLREYS